MKELDAMLEAGAAEVEEDDILRKLLLPLDDLQDKVQMQNSATPVPNARDVEEEMA